MTSSPPSQSLSLLLFCATLFVATLGGVATNLYLPSFPAIEQAFGVAKTSVQLSLALFLLGFGFSPLIYGPLSERHGRKAIILLGMGIGFIGTLIVLISPNIYLLIFGRIIQGSGLGFAPALFRAVLRDKLAGNALSHTLSLLTASVAFSMAITPALGGYLQAYFGWRMNFVFICFYLIVGAVLIGLFLPETLPKSKRSITSFRLTLRHFATLLKNPFFHLKYVIWGFIFR